MLMGPVQIEILTQLIKNRCGVVPTFDSGKILYKETIAQPVIGVGHFEPLRHYAEAHIRIEPAERGSGVDASLDCSEDILAKTGSVWSIPICWNGRTVAQRSVRP